MAYLYVDAGGNKDYTTINDALASAASTGDTIVIDPGLYEEQIYLDRHVNLKGNTTTPENGDIEIRPPSNWDPVLNINYNASTIADKDFYFEGLYLHLVDSQTGRSVFTIANQSSGATRTSLFFNRCRIEGEVGPSNSLYGMSLADTYFRRLSYEHCLFNKIDSGTFNQFYNTYWSRCSEGGQIVACEYDRTSSYGSGNGSPFPHNYVTTTTSGYGPAYGTDYIKIPYGYFEGYVKEQNSAVQRTLYLHERETGQLVTSATSDVTGYYYMETPASGSHYIVCKDDPAAPIYNDLIVGNAYPTAL